MRASLAGRSIMSAIIRKRIRRRRRWRVAAYCWSSSPLFGQSYQALNGGPQFTFDEAISLSVGCADQAELDRYFDALTGDGGKAGPCGWVTDKYGLSWQLVTDAIMANYHSDDKAAIARMMAAMMTMQKLDTAAMQAAFDGETA